MKNLKIVYSFLLTITLMTASSNLFAQAFKWEFAIEGGIGLRSMKIDPPYPSLNTKVGSGVMIGIAGQYNIDYTWAIKLGAAYETKGSDLERTDINTTGKFNSDYIAIPLLLKATFGKKIRFYVNAGPYVGILTSSKTRLDATGTSPEIVIDNDSTNKKTDFGITGGAGMEVPLGRTSAITLELRDNFGLTNVSESKETNAPKIKNNTLIFMMGYVFMFGKNR